MALQKAKITIDPAGPQFDVLFNPEEYTINTDNTFASQAVPGLGAPILQFVHGNMRTLEIELFFDTVDAHTDVRLETQKIVSLMQIDSNLHAPPVLRVTWASLQFRCVLARANQKFIKFQEDGTPVRARVSVTFNEFVDAATQAQQDNLQTADYSKVHIVEQGETLSSLAGKLYEDATLWRPIALANGLQDPRSVFVGQPLRIPSLPFRDPNSGELMK